MKNKEKFADKILDFACSEERIAVDNQGEVVSCSGMASCEDCKFYIRNCETSIRKWLEEEYIEPTVISKRDRAFLEYIREDHKYIARNKSGNLFICETKPRKSVTCWNMDSLVREGYLYSNRHFNVDFPMIKWGDKEPWKIEDLKKLKVVDEYE